MQSFLLNKPDYFQIRLISALEYGQEIIRFDKIDKTITRVPAAKLQNKANRFYFRETLNVGEGNYYFSPITLNEEFGVISTPLTPTLRAASPLENTEDVPLGILIINVDMTGYFDQLRQIGGTNFEIMLVDENDQYIFAPDFSKTFGRQMMTGETFNRDFSTSIEDLYAKENTVEKIIDQEGVSRIFDIEKITYAGGQRQLYLVVSMKENLLLRSLLQVQRKSSKLVLIISLLALIAAILFTRIFSRNLLKITDIIANYSDENSDLGSMEKLLIRRQDEIGVLTRTFQEMKRKIDDQVMALKNSLEKEHKAIKERDEFLQNMSHELRTPLHGIIGLSKLLEKNNPTRSQEPIIRSLIKSAENLSGLLHDVLDHQKLKEGAITIDLQPAFIGETLLDIYSAYQYSAVQKGLKFTHDIDQRLFETEYLTDVLRLTQIVTNLVVNAIKYTEKGTIKLVATITQDNGYYQIKIIDTGIGIKEENLEHIRERFYREDDRLTSGDGFGLGLSIVRELLILFDGKLEIISALGKGSTFEIQLPLLVPSGSREIPEEMSGSKGIFPKLINDYKILHIEDDLASQLLMTHELDGLPFHLTQVDNMKMGVDYLKAENFDLIISDLMIGGNNMTKNIANLRKTFLNIPILLVSAADDKIMQNISDTFLQKPFEQYLVASYLFVILGANEYTSPKMDRMYKQYDYDSNSISKYLDIMITEFEVYCLRFEEIYQEHNQDLWHAQRHRLSTHLRSLHLENVLAAIPENVGDISEHELQHLINQLRYCLCFFKVEHNKTKGYARQLEP